VNWRTYSRVVATWHASRPHHAEITRLAIERRPTRRPARIADLNERVAKAEMQLQWTKQVEEAERERLEAEDRRHGVRRFRQRLERAQPSGAGPGLALLVSRVEFNAEDSTITVTFHPWHQVAGRKPARGSMITIKQKVHFSRVKAGRRDSCRRPPRRCRWVGAAGSADGVGHPV
jgi:hypothetical protein